MLDCSILAKTILVNTEPNEFPGLLMVLNGKSTSARGYPYGASGYLGGYPMGGYGAVGYGGTPIVSPRSPLWNSSAMVGSRRSPMPFGGPAMYPGYLNGGFVGMPGAGYRGIMGPTAANGKWNMGGDAQMPGAATSPGVDGGKLTSWNVLILQNHMRLY
ncbi:uncharacterized protein LOC113276120 isoform X3 [Papaver somniferum]|uniref:uncharacterized protein LOC113276120 isoform X3 n=1 Tax=Papaver somniferum TaxID=3469 RepID=UPI000E6F6593|nr:uncharacterized protein LOC113276120 isoform X3 [Papaver somniferum]